MRNGIGVLCSAAVLIISGATAGCDAGNKKNGALVAKALCAQPGVLKQLRTIKDNSEVMGREPTEDEVRGICTSFLDAMQTEGVSKTKALLTLGGGGKKIWQGTIAPAIQRDCAAEADTEEVGALAAVLLACKPIGAW